jgi:hypothetical protein
MNKDPTNSLIAPARARQGEERQALLAICLRRARALTHTNAIIGLTVLLFVVPALLDLLSDERRAYGYLAPDAFYFFTIGMNWVRFGIPTYDQQFVTNGFHPLWQWVVAALFKVISWMGFTRFTLAPASVVVGLAFISAALVLLGRTMGRGGRLSPWFLLLPVGVFPAIVSPWWWVFRDEMIPLFGTLWCFANGMESALTILTYAVVAWLFVRRPVRAPGGALVFGSALGLMSLARLDHTVFAVVMLLGMLYQAVARKSPLGLRLTLFTALAWGTLLGGYLSYNKIMVGRFMPVSGAVKSTFPSITTGSIEALASFRSLAPRGKLYHLGRAGSIVATAIGALVYLPFAVAGRGWSPPRSGDDERVGQLLLMTALGAILLAVYDVLFVTNMHIGQWYAPVSILFLSLVAIRGVDRIRARRLFRFAPLAATGIVLALGSATLVYFWGLQRVLPWGTMYADFCLSQVSRAVAHYGPSPPKFISYDDGVTAFATGFPTTSGTLLALDPAAEAAWRSGGFEELMTRRGVDRVMLLQYHLGEVAAEHVGKSSDELREYASTVLHDRPDAYDLEVEYSDGPFAVLRVHPRR